MNKWPIIDLERRLCHALDVAVRAIDHLASAGYTDEQDPSNSVRPEKVIAETAVLLLAASAPPSSDQVKGRIHHLAHRLIPHARSERMKIGACLEPSLALDFSTAHLCLKHLGLKDPSFDSILTHALSSQSADGRERVPHRVLEQEWLKSLANDKSSPARRWIQIARASVLGAPMDLLNATRDDIYAFTHALMYLTGFQHRTCRLPRARTTLLAEAEGSLARCLDEEDYDLGGEVLLAWPLTGNTWTPSALFGFQVLAKVEDRAGFLPAPITRLQRLHQLTGDDRSRYLLATGYHTVYVMGLLCAAALQPDRIPPASIPTGSSTPGGASRLLEIIDDGRHQPHWKTVFDQLRPIQQDALAGLLLSIGLRRKTRQRDYSGMAQLLSEGHQLGLTNRPIAGQAAEMLNRLALYTNPVSLRQTA